MEIDGPRARLLFCKSKVYTHPTASQKDNISGFLALLEVLPHHFLAWIPESKLGEARKKYDQVELSLAQSLPEQPPSVLHYASSGDHGTSEFSVPISQIYSLHIRPPNRGWWHGSIVIHTKQGTSFPGLFFHDDECPSTKLQKQQRLRDSFDPFAADGSLFWGGDEVLRWLRHYVDVQKSGADPSIYLVDPSTEDVAGFAPAQTSTPEIDPVARAFKNARWSFLEKMSQVTNFTRRAALELTENKNIPPQMRRLMKNPEVQVLQQEFDSARIYLARWALSVADQGNRQRVISTPDFEMLEIETAPAERRRPITKEEWTSFFDYSTGTLQRTVSEIKERIFLGGLDPNDGVRKEAWLFLLGVYSWGSSCDERRRQLSEKRDEFVRLKGAWWDRLIDPSTSLEVLEGLREQKAQIEKDVHRTDRHIPLFEGEDIPHPDPDSPFAEIGTNVHLEQMKDMLMTFNEHNRDLGYVQGMSDLLAPLYAVEQDDAVAFWAFTGFMHRMERNFLRDQSGMRQQLLTLDQLVRVMDSELYLHLQRADSTNFFFFFRMMLVWYKREFAWADILRLWEALWTDWLSRNFHLFIALAILERNKEALMQLQRFDEVLKYVNELSNRIDLPSTLIRAEALFHRFQRLVEAIDKKDNFPSPGQRSGETLTISPNLRALLST